MQQVMYISLYLVGIVYSSLQSYSQYFVDFYTSIAAYLFLIQKHKMLCSLFSYQMSLETLILEVKLMLYFFLLTILPS